MQNLQSIPGVGPVVAYAFVAHMGDGSRFSMGAAGKQFHRFYFEIGLFWDNPTLRGYY